MKRDEFETILKRALELQGHQSARDEDSLSEQDLANAARRLQIPPEVLHQAFLDFRKSRKQFRVQGTPDEVREAFLKNFLLNVAHPSRFPALRVDRKSLQIGKATTVRVQDPAFSEIDAEISFSADGADHTLVSWSGNSKLSWRSTAFISAIPFLIFSIMIAPVLASGVISAGLIPALMMPLFIWALMYYSFRQQTGRVDSVLTEYFENIQILGNLKDQKTTEQELLELRAWKEKMSAQSSATASTPAEEEPSPASSEDSNGPTPPPPRMERES